MKGISPYGYNCRMLMLISYRMCCLSLNFPGFLWILLLPVNLNLNIILFLNLRAQICHTLTEKLVAMTMGSGAKVKAPASLSDIITVAKRISPR